MQIWIIGGLVQIVIIYYRPLNFQVNCWFFRKLSFFKGNTHLFSDFVTSRANDNFSEKKNKNVFAQFDGTRNSVCSFALGKREKVVFYFFEWQLTTLMTFGLVRMKRRNLITLPLVKNRNFRPNLPSTQTVAPVKADAIFTKAAMGINFSLGRTRIFVTLPSIYPSTHVK